MKNLFKNLMLVAVAAMAFTACTETGEEVNAVSKVTRYEFTANIAEETRSGFAEKEEGATAYKSEWFGDENLKVFVTDYNAYNVEKTVAINAEGQFTLELEDAPESFFVTVVSPAESWESEYTANLPEVQTPLANSVDPAAHLLQAQAKPVTYGENAAIEMSHMIAYGKMTVNGVAFAIDHVVVDLKGSFYGYDREYSYTISAANVQNNTFWFATEPIDVAEFTITAYDAEGNSVTKTVDVAAAGKTMSFNYGRVGTFSVSGLEEAKETYDSTYAYVYQSYGATDKEIMFVAEDGRGLRIDFYNVYENNCILPGTYTFSGSGYMYPNWCYYYDNVDNTYTSKLNGGQAVVSVEDGQYKIVFTNMALESTVYVESFTFKGEIDGLDIPDPRVKLATPELAYTNEGMVVTLSWNAIEGVEYYSVECDSEAIDNFTTTETSAIITLPGYGVYGFTVTAKVADNNENYKSSDAASVKVVVKDPNAWADYELTNVAVSGSYVTMSDANDNRVTFYMNAADRIGNGIKLGDYTFVASETPAVGTFVTYIVSYDGTWKYAHQIGSGSMNVAAENGEYKILITVDGIRFGFVGTDVLGAPITDPTIIASTEMLSFGQAGGSKTVDLTLANLTEDITVTSTNNHFTATVSGNVLTVVAPENTVEAAQEATITLSANGATATITVSQEAYDPNFVPEDGSEEHPYTFASVASNGFFLNFEGATNGASLQLDRQNSDVNQMSNYDGPFALNYTAIIYSGSGNYYTVGGTTYYYADFAPYSTCEVTKADGNWTIKLKMSIDSGATYTYYTYTGQIANQAY
ncbi:MAG: BACON domain-containing protein [Alistipes sp.]|nr:BACON domain-containing protein [Alistipes sp.]